MKIIIEIWHFLWKIIGIVMNIAWRSRRLTMATAGMITKAATACSGRNVPQPWLALVRAYHRHLDKPVVYTVASSANEKMPGLLATMPWASWLMQTNRF